LRDAAEQSAPTASASAALSGRRVQRLYCEDRRREKFEEAEAGRFAGRDHRRRRVVRHDELRHGWTGQNAASRICSSVKGHGTDNSARVSPVAAHASSVARSHARAQGTRPVFGQAGRVREQSPDHAPFLLDRQIRARLAVAPQAGTIAAD